jgi:hypothetical protein
VCARANLQSKLLEIEDSRLKVLEVRETYGIEPEDVAQAGNDVVAVY